MVGWACWGFFSGVIGLSGAKGEGGWSSHVRGCGNHEDGRGNGQLVGVSLDMKSS